MSTAPTSTPPSLDSPAAAAQLLLAHTRPVSTERVPLAAASGRILAEPITADRPSPPSDVSAMDGFAVRIAEVPTSERPIRVAGEIRIGAAPPALPKGQALRIVTGAPVPDGADAVIPREHVREEGDRIVVFPGVAEGLKPNASIRRQGENAPAGAAILQPGTPLTPAAISALAAVGAAAPLVFRQVRAAVLVTGDELLDVTESPSPYQLRDSNGPVLRALLSSTPWLATPIVRRAPDDPAAIRSAAADLLGQSDILFLSGGVSMGDRDFVPRVLAELDAQALFHKVAQRPGRPVLGAVSAHGQPILALPGNPVSVLVTARRLGGPVLQQLAGRARSTPPIPVTLGNPDAKSIPMWWHRPVRINDNGTAHLIDARGSGDIPATAPTDGFVELSPNHHGPGPWPFYSWGL